jgi:hypothetical protein
MLWGAKPMRRLVAIVIAASLVSSPVLAQSAASRAPSVSSAEIEKGIEEAARSLDALSRIMAVMGPGLSKAMQAASPSLGRAVTSAQPSLARAMAVAQPQIEAMGTRMSAPTQRPANAGAPTGAELARTMQGAAASLESLSRMMGSVAPDLGKAYDAAAPELRNALAQARPALDEAIKAAEPELRRLAPQTQAPSTTTSPSTPVSDDTKIVSR